MLVPVSLRGPEGAGRPVHRYPHGTPGVPGGARGGEGVRGARRGRGGALHLRPEPRAGADAHGRDDGSGRSEEHTSELQSRPHLVCRLLLEKKKTKKETKT